MLETSYVQTNFEANVIYEEVFKNPSGMVFPQHSGGGGRNIMTSKSAWNTQ
jgi:hypothetical protein